MSIDGPLGSIRRKLVETKQRWAEQGRGMSGRRVPARAERLPPGQHLTDSWPVLDLGVQPHITPDRWSLTIDGYVERPLRWDWAAYQDQPRFRDVSDMHCVTTWSRYDNHWEGVSTAHVLALVKPLPQARHVVCHSFDGYTTNLTLAHFSAPDALIADHWEGEPISREHGGPVRMIVPQLYLWKSAKWLSRIEFVTDDEPGFWEVRGYHNVGDPWTEQRYS